MTIKLDNAILETKKDEKDTLIDVYMRDNDKHWEYRGCFIIGNVQFISTDFYVVFLHIITLYCVNDWGPLYLR